MADIVYVLPRTSRPSGGVNVMLEHVEILEQHGISAFALGNADFEPWRTTEATIVRNGPRGWRCSRGSVLIVHELVDTPFLKLFDARPDVKRLVFCQSYRGIDGGVLMDLVANRIDGIMASSPVVATALDRVAGIRGAPIVSCHVDRSRFRPTTKGMSVAYMPSKIPWAKDKIASLLPKSAMEFQWLPIDDKTQEEAADIISGAAVFLALGFREGFGLPPLQAMASGCLVVGFHAQGARSYADPTNGFWHDETDFGGCARSLHKAVAMFQQAGPEYHAMIAAGMSTVDRYTRHRTEGELIQALTAFLNSQNRSLQDYRKQAT